MNLSGVPTYHFATTNVQHMVSGALGTAQDAEEEYGVSEVQVLIAVNDLRHAAAELERSLLEEKYDVARRH